MTSSLPNEPLWPRAFRSGMSVATRSSSSFVAPVGNGTDAGVAAPPAGASRRPNPTGPRSGTLRFPVCPGRSVGRERLGAACDRDRAEALDPGQDAAFALVEALLDVEREDIPPPRRPDPEGDRDGVVRFVADRDGHALHPELLGAVGSAAVEADRWLSGRQPLDLDVAPADASDSEAEDLRDGLLGRPPAGHRLGAAPDVAPFGFRQDAPGEAIAEALERCPDAIDLDDVDPELARPGRNVAVRHRSAIRP